MVNYFVDLASRAGHLGYLIVSVIVMLECQQNAHLKFLRAHEQANRTSALDIC